MPAITMFTSSAASSADELVALLSAAVRADTDLDSSPSPLIRRPSDPTLPAARALLGV
jgi:hypothetical protein